MKKIELIDTPEGDGGTKANKKPGGGTGGVDPNRAERFLWKDEHLVFPKEKPKNEQTG